MHTTRGKLTVAQASRPAITADCITCGGQAIFVVATAKAAVDHRCGTDLVGPTWSLVERPPADRNACRRSVERLIDGGVVTREQAAAHLARLERAADDGDGEAAA